MKFNAVSVLTLPADQSKYCSSSGFLKYISADDFSFLASISNTNLN